MPVTTATVAKLTTAAAIRRRTVPRTRGRASSEDIYNHPRHTDNPPTRIPSSTRLTFTGHAIQTPGRRVHAAVVGHLEHQCSHTAGTSVVHRRITPIDRVRHTATGVRNRQDETGKAPGRE